MRLARLCSVTEGVNLLQQYALLLDMVAATVGLVLGLDALARAVGRMREETGKDVPATAGELSS